MNKKILILANHDVGLYNFRKELLQKLIAEDYEVIVSCPPGDNTKKIKEIGCAYIEVDLNRHGMNPIEEIKLIRYYRKLMKNVQPDIIFSYTIKPNIYGAIAARKYSIPFVANVTGLGTAVQNPGVMREVITGLYKSAFSKVQTVFFQNKTNQQFFLDNNIASEKHKLLPGSGVNLSKFEALDYPKNDEIIHFVFISRIMKDKGIEEYLHAAEYVKGKHPNTRFHICGFLDGDYKNVLDDYIERDIIEYHGMVNDVRTVFKSTHATVLPSYHEGMSNVLLESAASGRPVLASDIPGCQETFDEGISGFGLKSKNPQSLIKAIEKFLQLTIKEKEQMGLAGREKVEQEFDRQIVVNKYLNEIKIAVEAQ